jgi:hypothetical protein
MNEKDKEAFTEWYKNKKSEFDNCEEAWKSAIEYERFNHKYCVVGSLDKLCEKLEAENKRLREALEFYANWKNYSSANHDYFEKYFATINNDHSFLEITENDGDNFTLPFGGKKAREALKEVGEK